MIYGICARRRWGSGGHLTPLLEWDVLAACMFGAPSMTNNVVTMNKKQPKVLSGTCTVKNKHENEDSTKALSHFLMPPLFSLLTNNGKV